MRLQILMSALLMTGSEFSVMKREISSNNFELEIIYLKKLNFDYFTQVNVCDRTVLETKESK